MASSSYFNSSELFQSRLITALRHNIVEKCSELTTIIQEAIDTNIKDIQSFYPLLIENLFAFGSQKDNAIDMKIISAQNNPAEFNSLFSLLHPDGPIFRLIRHLMCDNYYRCQFPIACLPAPTKSLIEESIIPDFYMNRLSSDGSSVNLTHISLNPFEFFLFHFCYHVYQSKMSPVNFDKVPTNLSSVLYIVLVEIYLDYFLPIDSAKSVSNNSPGQDLNNSPSSLWQSLSSTTSILLNLNTGQNSSNNLPKSSLLNLKALVHLGGDIPNSSQSTHKTIDQFGSPLIKINTLVNIFTEMWLNVKLPSSLSKKSPSPNHSSNFLSPDLMKCVRILIKHLHYFSNSNFQMRRPLLNSPMFENSEIDEAKRTIWSDKYLIQRRLFSFFRVSFEKWPLDASFRLPLECWLSFIQPWRYMDPSVVNKNDETSDDVNCSSDNNSIDRCWKKFINDNLLFYTSLFHQLIPRFMRMDFSSSKNAFMLFRVVKVYYQTNLKELISEAEQNLECAMSPLRGVSKGSLLSPLRSPRNAIHQNTIYKHELEFEQNEFNYIPLFSSTTTKEIKELLKYLKVIQKEINDQVANVTKREESTFNFLAFIKLFSTEEDYRGMEGRIEVDDKAKTNAYIEIICTRLTHFFDIQIDDKSVSTRQQATTDDSPTSSGIDLSLQNIAFSMTNIRSETVNSPSNEIREIDRKMRNKKIGYYGNPDCQPVRSFEFEFMVMFLHYISCLINDRYGEAFKRLYYQHGFFNTIARAILKPPTTYIEMEKHDAFSPPIRRKISLAPRICLRTFANKTLYKYLISFYLILYALGFGKWTFLLSINVIFIVNILISALFTNYKK